MSSIEHNSQQDDEIRKALSDALLRERKENNKMRDQLLEAKSLADEWMQKCHLARAEYGALLEKYNYERLK